VLTLGQVQNSSVANVAGVNNTDPQFAQLVNDSVEQLMDIGSWWGTVQPLLGCVYDSVVVWPIKVDAVLGIDILRHPAKLENHWFHFVPMDERHREWALGYHQGHRPRVEFEGTTPLFYPPSSTNPMTMQFTCDNPIDYGKTVTVYGVDTNGHEVFATRPDGSSQRGIVLTLATPNVQMPVALQAVTSIVKDITSGTVRAWSVAPVTNVLTMVGYYRAGDTSPQYLYSRMPNYAQSISALVKIGFQPVNQASDILSLDCLDAIKCQVQSIKARDAGDPEKSLFYEKMAIRRLNMQMRTRFPMEQFVFAFRPFGGDTLNKQKVGRMI
jgi:hypothetical protein